MAHAGHPACGDELMRSVRRFQAPAARVSAPASSRAHARGRSPQREAAAAHAWLWAPFQMTVRMTICRGRRRAPRAHPLFLMLQHTDVQCRPV